MPRAKRPFARTSARTFAASEPAAADAPMLAWIAGALVIGTLIAFTAMVATAWPAAAGEAPALQRLALVAPVAPPVSPGTGALEPVALPGLTREARPCASETLEAEADLNATLAKVEALEESPDHQAQCAAIRAHVSSLGRAVASAERCSASRDRVAKVSTFRQSAAEWRSVLTSTCH